MKQHEKQEAVAEDAKAVGQAVADVLSSFPPQKLDMVKDDGSIPCDSNLKLGSPENTF